MEIIAALAFCFNITQTSVTIQNISSPIHVKVAGFAACGTVVAQARKA